MQCDPNSSAMLTRSIVKQMKPRLESPAAEDWDISARCKSSTKPLQAPLEPNWTAGSHTHCSSTSTSTNVFYYQKICSLDHLSASWVDWQYLRAGAWAQAMPYLGETQVWGRSVWLWLSGVVTLGWKLQAWSQFLAHSWAPILHISTGKRKGKEVPKSKHHSKGAITKTGSAGQRSRELAFYRTWQYLG